MKNQFPEFNAQTLTTVENSIFECHSLQESSDSLDLLFFSYMCTEEPSDFERQTATVSFFRLKKLLQTVKNKIHPEEVLVLEINCMY